jgi:hypothetical protein
MVVEIPQTSRVGHGSGAAYSYYGCRCEVCRKAHGERGRKYRLRNVERFRAQRRAEYARNPERFQKTVRARYFRHRNILNRYKTMKGCRDCGYSDNAVALQFHHKNRATKGFNISEHIDASWAKIKTEVAKCDVLCANCHSILEERIRWLIWPT